MPYAEQYTDTDIEQVFNKVRRGIVPEKSELMKLKSAVMYQLALMYSEKDWMMQLHIGALRNNNIRMIRLIGPDSEFDAIADCKRFWMEFDR